MELTTTALMQSYLGDTSLFASLLATYGNAAEEQIAQYCNRHDYGGNHWLSASRTEYVRVDMHEQIVLRWAPVTAVTSVSTVDSSTTVTALALTDIDIDGQAISGLTSAVNGILSFRRNPAGLWAAGYVRASTLGEPSVTYPNFGRGLIKVVYTGGYSAAPPAAILAATELAATMYRKRSVNPLLQSERLGSYDYTLNGGGAADPLATVMAGLRQFVRYPTGGGNA